MLAVISEERRVQDLHEIDGVVTENEVTGEVRLGGVNFPSPSSEEKTQSEQS